jgi:hypothetical protein
MFIFAPSVIYISLNNQILKSCVVQTKLDSLISWFGNDLPNNESLPYTYFLNQYLSCDLTVLGSIIKEIKDEALKSNTFTLSNKIYDALNEYRNSDNLFLKHCATTIFQSYTLLCSLEPDKYSVIDEVNDFEWSYNHMKISNYSIYEIFSAYNLMPYNIIDQKKKDQILTDSTWGLRNWETSNQMDFNIVPVIKHFIYSMKIGGIYLQECKECHELFARVDKRRTIFCKGTYCENDKNACTDQYSRYKKQMEKCEYLRIYETTKNYFNQRVKRGNLSPEKRDQWGKEARLKKKKVQINKMSEVTFINWLNDTRQNAINELKALRE